jgi:hypothetical protein
MVQEALKRDPMCGHLFVSRGLSGGLIKVIWHDDEGRLSVHKEAGAQTLHLAISRGCHGGDHTCAARLSAGGRRLADAAKNLAADVGRRSPATASAG